MTAFLLLDSLSFLNRTQLVYSAQLITRWNARRRIWPRRDDPLLTDVVTTTNFFASKAEFYLPAILTFLLNCLSFWDFFDVLFLTWSVLETKDALINLALLRDFLLRISGRLLIIGNVHWLRDLILVCSLILFLRRRIVLRRTRLSNSQCVHSLIRLLPPHCLLPSLLFWVAIFYNRFQFDLLIFLAGLFCSLWFRLPQWCAFFDRLCHDNFLKSCF